MKRTRIRPQWMLHLAGLLLGMAFIPAPADAAPSPEYRTALFAAG